MKYDEAMIPKWIEIKNLLQYDFHLLPTEMRGGYTTSRGMFYAALLIS